MIDPYNRGLMSLDNMVLREWCQTANYLIACKLVRTVHITSVITFKQMAKEKLPSEYALNC